MRSSQSHWLALALLMLAGCSDPVQKALEADGLYVKDAVEGAGEPVVAGDYVRVSYVASLWVDGKTGTEVARSGDRPQVFTVGRGTAMPGWDKGLLGMRAGGRRTLVVGPALAAGPGAPPWGAEGKVSAGKAPAGKVPPGSTLVYDIELLEVPRTQVRDLVVGGGDEARPGDFVRVEFTGWLYEHGGRARQFDSSAANGGPFVFCLGAGTVIEGWEKGVPGMRVGGRRELIIPPEMGYGDRDMPGVPPGSTLLFDVTMLEMPRVRTRILTEGHGEPAKNRDVVEVHYTGWVQDARGGRGESFDTSRSSPRPFRAQLGAGALMPGWELGLLGMKVGEVRELVVPPELGYGNLARRGVNTTIPAGSTLIFEIALVALNPN